MPKTPKPKPDDPEQSRRFEETARTLDVDESDEAFKKAMEVVVPAKQEAAPVHPNEKKSSR